MPGTEFWNGVDAARRDIINELSVLSGRKLKKRINEYAKVMKIQDRIKNRMLKNGYKKKSSL